MLRQFYRHCTEVGYSGEIAYRRTLHLLRELVRSGASERRAFAEQFAAEHDRRIPIGRRKGAAFEGDVRRFFEHIRLVPRSRDDDWRFAVRVHALLASTPAGLRVGLDHYWATLEDEREYRGSTGERCRTPRTQAFLFIYRLIPCARFLETSGLSSWQELTPERFRVAFQTRGIDPRYFAAELAPLRLFLGFLQAEKKIFRNPLQSVRAKSLALPIEWKAPDLDSLLARIADEQTPPALRAVGALIVIHGCRPIDVTSLHVSDFKVRARQLELRRWRRRIALDPVTYDALVAYLAVRRSPKRHPWMIVSSRSQKTGQPADIRGYLRALNLVSTAARQELLRQVLDRENLVVAARVLDLSVGQVGRHLRQYTAGKIA